MDDTALDKFAEWKGRRITVEDLLTPTLVVEFEATLSPNLYRTERAVAPLGAHWCLGLSIARTDELGPDGHPLHDPLLPPLPLPRRMWAGSEIEFLADLKIGERVTRQSTVSDIRPKQGRSGRLCFVQLRHEFFAEQGVAIREHQNLVFREAAESDAAKRVEPSHDDSDDLVPDLSWRFDASAVMLFRYSALTFNSHRIHYDHRYTTEIEQYPGLIVHGPLQATLLLNMAATLLGRVPSRFTCRALKPLIAEQTVTIVGRIANGTAVCQSRDSVGQICMISEAVVNG